MKVTMVFMFTKKTMREGHFPSLVCSGHSRAADKS